MAFVSNAWEKKNLCRDFLSSISLYQIYSNREVEEAMTKIRDVLSDDKKDWELRVAAVRCPDISVTMIL